MVGALPESNTDKKDFCTVAPTQVGLCSPDLPNFSELCIQADQDRVSKVLHNSDHQLHCPLPPVTTSS